MRPQVADAALVYLAGREKIETVFTLDRRDFSVYRASGRRALSIVP
jgi:predicted nucleic acid-binding protein